MMWGRSRFGVAPTSLSHPTSVIRVRISLHVSTTADAGICRVAAVERKRRPEGRPAPVSPRGMAGSDDNDDMEALRRRVEELESGNALMREVVEPVKKTQAPSCGARRTGRRRFLIDRLRPAHFARLDDVLARHRAEQLPLPPRQVRRRQVRRAARPGGRDVHRFQKHKAGTGIVGSRPCSGRRLWEAVRRIMAEDGLAVHVPRRRRCSSYEGGTMPAPGNLRRPRFRRRSPEREMAHGHHAGLRLATGLCPRRDARPNRRIHPPVRPRTHQTVTGLDKSGTIPSKPRNDCMTISEKTSAPQQAARQNRIQEKNALP